MFRSPSYIVHRASPSQTPLHSLKTWGLRELIRLMPTKQRFLEIASCLHRPTALGEWNSCLRDSHLSQTVNARFAPMQSNYMLVYALHART